MFDIGDVVRVLDFVPSSPNPADYEEPVENYLGWAPDMNDFLSRELIIDRVLDCPSEYPDCVQYRTRDAVTGKKIRYYWCDRFFEKAPVFRASSIKDFSAAGESDVQSLYSL